MKTLYNILFILFTSNFLMAQSTWDYYAIDYWIQGLKVVDGHAFVGNPTGFHVIDIETKESKLFQSVNSELRGSFVWELLAKDNHVWIALNEGGIAKYSFEEDKLNGSWEQFYTPTAQNDTIQRPRNLIEDDDGTLWFDDARGSRGFLKSLKDGNILDHSDIFTEQPYDFSCHGSKRVYFSSSSSPLNYVDLETVSTVSIPLLNIFGEINSFTSFNDKLFVSLTDIFGRHHLYLYDNNWHKIADLEETIHLQYATKGKNKIWATNYSPSGTEFISISEEGYEKITFDELPNNETDIDHITEVLYQEENDRIWLTSYNTSINEALIYSILNEEVEKYDITHASLKSYFSFGDPLIFDCDGNLMIYSEIFNPDTVITVPFTEDLTKIVNDPTTCLYYGLKYEELYNISTIYIFNENSIMDSIVILNRGFNNFLVTSEGQLVITTSEDGIGFYDKSTKEWTWHKELLWNPTLNRYNSVSNIQEHATGAITFLTYNSIIVYHEESWEVYNKSNSPFGEDYLYTHIIDSKGNLIVGRKGGVYIYNNIEWEFIGFEELSQNSIICIHEDDNGNYWFGSIQNGLFFWNGNSYTQYHIMNSALPSNYISAINQHPLTEDLWLNNERGIAVFDPDDYNFKEGVFGKVFYDSAKDSIYNVGDDVGISDVFININESTVLTDDNGFYSYFPENEDSLTIECIIPADFEATNPTTVQTTFADEDIYDINFGMWKEIESAELEVDLSLSPFLCSSEISVWMTIDNPGWKTVDGTATLSFPEDIHIISTYPEADNISTHSASWDFEELSYREKRSLSVVIQGPTIEEVVAQNDSLNEVTFDVFANLEYEGKTINSTKNVPFLCAYDPNDKLSNSVGPSIDKYSLLEDDLIYTIRFQNESNYKATNVIITDTISSNLDMTSLEIVSSSHHVQTQINENNALVFRFLDIDLPPKSENESASQGFVKFKISPITDLPDNSTILNNAYVYFDNNAPIITNTTEDILVEELPITNVEDIGVDNIHANVFPNPSTERFEIYSNSNNYRYSVYDFNGRQVLTGVSNKNNSIFDIQLSGVYFVIIRNDYGSKTVKIVKI